AATQADQMRNGIVPSLRDEARGSLGRMQGMIQENAGRSIVRAAQRMRRNDVTDADQLRFIKTLGNVQSQMILRQQNAIPLSQEFLGSTIVGRVLATDMHRRQIQEQLGASLRDAGIMAAKLDREEVVAQESLGSAVMV